MKKLLLIIIAACFLIFASSCSYRKFEDKVRAKFEKRSGPAVSQSESKSTEDTDAAGEAAGKGEYTPGPEVEKIEPEHLHQLGEVIQYKIGDRTGVVEFCVKKGALFSSFAEAGIDTEMLNPAVDISDVIGSNGSFKDHYRLLLTEITVKRVSEAKKDDPFNISSVSMAYHSLSKNEQFIMPEIVYFSDAAPKKDELWKNYYEFQLPVGKGKAVKVGWLVDTSIFNISDILLCVRSENKEYVILGLQ